MLDSLRSGNSLNKLIKYLKKLIYMNIQLEQFKPLHNNQT